MQPHKSWLFSQDAEAAASLAAFLDMPHSAEGMVMAGCPVSTQAFIANHAYTAAEEVAHLIDNLFAIGICGLVRYGRLGRAAVELIGGWADAAAGNGAFDRDAHLTWDKRELSVSLVLVNARLFKKSVGVLTRGNGQRFVEGMDVPVSE